MAELVGGRDIPLNASAQCASCHRWIEIPFNRLRITQEQQLASQFDEAGAPLCQDCLTLAKLAYDGYESWRGFGASVSLEEVFKIISFMRVATMRPLSELEFQSPRSSGLLWDLIPMLAGGYNGRGYNVTLWLGEILRAALQGDDPRAANRGETLLMRLTSIPDDWDFGVINQCETAGEVFAKESPYEAAASILISAGAQIEARNSMGNTAVLQAALGGGQYGRTKGLALALKLGGDPYAKDQFGKNAFDIARDREAKVLEIWKSTQNAVLHTPAQGRTAESIFGKAAPTTAPFSAGRRSELMRQTAQVFDPKAQSWKPIDEA